MTTSFTQEFNWIRLQMPLVQKALEKLPRLDGVRLACSVHLEIKMVQMFEALMERGAELFLTTCNPKTVRDDVIEYLSKKGASTHAWFDMSPADYSSGFERALDWEPTHLCEMGADLTYTLTRNSDRAKNSKIKASLEATGSGITRLGQLTPPYPIFNWDDVPIKEGLHNRHMVGLTAWHAFLSRTGLTLHGKRVSVIGFGLVGRGVADIARAYGGTVSIVEKDVSRSLEAKYGGWEVKTLNEAILESDVIVTATGVSNIIQSEHFPMMKNGVILMNVGHQAREIDTSSLLLHSHREIIPFIREVDLGHKRIYLFAEGSMANLVAGCGDSFNSFDIILAVMISGISHIVGAGSKTSPGVYLLPKAVWEPFVASN
ncbi:MAG: adenosylhomocysteinase [Oligoflexia bacterium]|nr:adenosylhomocysteinase [Oligoflexia bacterium]MBF0367231.1 adenosylhomocysteinase [Oligoflexia bacterium]